MEHVMTLWQAAVLGLVEGITEYLPVSSTGHLVIARALLGLEGDDGAAPWAKRNLDDFLVVIQGGAILAVLGLYWPRIVRMLRGLAGKDPAGLRLLGNLVIAFLPAAVFGKLLHDWIESRLFFVGPVAAAAAAGGVYMILVEQWRRGKVGLPAWHARQKTIDDMSGLDALLIGVMQCAALWPGTSRSMMTITAGLLLGMRMAQAAEFSFLLGLPTLGAATLYGLWHNVSHAKHEGVPNMFQQLHAGPILVGVVVATVAAVLAVRWLVGFLTRRGLTPFGWYRLGLAVLLVVLAGRGVIHLKPKVEVSGTRVVVPIQVK